MQDKTQKKGFFSKVEWSKPYYKELQNRLINKLGLLVVILIVAGFILAYTGQTEWATRLFMAVILVVGAIIGSVMAIQRINNHDLMEQKAKKDK